MLVVYKYNTTQARANLPTDDSSRQQVSLMGENILILSFTVSRAINFEIGDYCYFMNTRYEINSLPERIRNYIGSISYTLQMEAEMYDLGKTDYLFFNDKNQLTDTVFPQRGKAIDFANVIIYNLKRMYPLAAWKLGFIIDTDYVNIDVFGKNCLQVLQEVAQAFNTEYLIEGKTIHIYQRQNSGNLTLEYGMDKSLLDLRETKKDQSNIITRLYALGSTKNIEPTYRGGAQRLRMGDIDYIEKNIDKYRQFEFTVYFDGTGDQKEIFPHRTGTVTAVDDPFNFYDSTIDFNVLDYLLPDTSAKITFNTGLLSGYTFEIAENGYDPNAKKFTILKNTSETSVDVPSATYTPVIGDTYVITDITMPQSYINAAEQELRTAAQEYLDKNSIPALVYTGTCNRNYFKRNNINLVLAQTAMVKDDELEISKTLRITGYTRSINDVYLYTVELSEAVQINKFLKFISTL